MKNKISVGLILISIIILGMRTIKEVELKQNVTGYLKRAAAANTIPIAKEELAKTIQYLEANHLTSGYTSIFWKTPEEDVGFWYRNLKASQKELENLKSESALETTNVLLKLHETLIESGENESVTVPEGLAVFPNNKIWAFLILIAISLGFIGLITLIVEADKKNREKKKNQQNDTNASIA